MKCLKCGKRITNSNHKCLRDLKLDPFVLVWDLDDKTAGSLVDFIVDKANYTATWQQDDGSEIDRTTVEHGKTPSHAIPTKKPDEKYTYTFAGWTPKPAPASGNTTYKATYDATLRKYTIIWRRDDGSEIDRTMVEYGKTPSHAIPTKDADEKNTYSFAGWTPKPTPVTSNKTYKATYTETKISYNVNCSKCGNSFTIPYPPAKDKKVFCPNCSKVIRNRTIIIWQQNDGTEIDRTTVEHGKTPTHAVPTKETDAKYIYTFAGWTPEPAPVTSSTTYKATYTAKLRNYTIIWQQDDGSEIDRTTVEYGKTPTHAVSTKKADANYTYTFAEWTPKPAPVTGNAIYKATYTQTRISYRTNCNRCGKAITIHNRPAKNTSYVCSTCAERMRQEAEEARVRRNNRLYSSVVVNIVLVFILALLFIWKNSNFYQIICGGIGLAILCILSVLYGIRFFISETKWYEPFIGLSLSFALVILYIYDLIAKENPWYSYTIILFPVSVLIVLISSTILYSRLINAQGESEKRKKNCHIIITIATGIIFAVFSTIATVNAVKGFYPIESADSVEFGLYEQDGDESNGQEKIKWFVKKVTDGKALLVSQYILDIQQFNDSDDNNSWKKSSLRSWLNSDFVDIAFSPEEQATIAETDITTEYLSSLNSLKGTGMTEDTRDKVFINDFERPVIYKNYPELTVFASEKNQAINGQAISIIPSREHYMWLRNPDVIGQNIVVTIEINEGEENKTVYQNLSSTQFACIQPSLYVDVDTFNKMMLNANN